MKRNAMYVLMGVIVCAAGTVAVAASFPHERRAALATDAWGGMRVDWTAVADWPVGDTPVAKSAREWIENRLRNYSREPFKGDVADWDAMTRFYGKQFLAENGHKDIEWHWRRCDMDRMGRHLNCVGDFGAERRCFGELSKKQDDDTDNLKIGDSHCGRPVLLHLALPYNKMPAETIGRSLSFSLLLDFAGEAILGNVLNEPNLGSND